jgi:hypothetical protein
MKVGTSWVWLLIICIANIALGVYYFYTAQLMLGFVYVGFGIIWGALAYTAHAKKQKSSEK